MTMFKKKKEKPAVIYSVELELQKAREKKVTSFYYPLWDLYRKGYACPAG